MNLSIFGNTAITIFALIAAPAAHATTVTFDALPDYGTAIDDYINTGGFTPYVENGVTVTPNPTTRKPKAMVSASTSATRTSS